MDENVHNLLTAGLWIIGLSIVALIVVIFWNMAAPEAARFLTLDETNRLKDFIFSGAIGSALVAAGRRVSGREDNSEDV